MKSKKTAILLITFLAIGFVLVQIPNAYPVFAQGKKTSKKVKAKPFSYKNSKGKTYYLFSREQKVKNSDKTFTMYFFASDPNNKKGTPLSKIPSDRKLSETKSGLPVLKKK